MIMKNGARIIAATSPGVLYSELMIIYAFSVGYHSL